MVHLDLKRAPLSESAKQLTETIKATSNNQGDIRFIQTLPRYTDLRLIEAAETAAGCRQTGTTQSSRSPPPHPREHWQPFERTFISVEGGGNITFAIHTRR